MWYVQTGEGEHFGPVPRDELDEWVEEGRVDSSCQLLRGDWDQWQWADTEYPELQADETSNVATKTADVPTVPSVASPATITPTAPSTSTTPQPEPKAARSNDESREFSEQVRAMHQTVPWIGLISRLGMAASGLLAVAVLFLAYVGVTTNNASLLFQCILSLAGGFFFTFVPSWMLFNYFRATRHFLSKKNQESLTIALIAQQKFWHYMGITYIVGFALALIGVFVLMATGATLLSS